MLIKEVLYSCFCKIKVFFIYTILKRQTLIGDEERIYRIFRRIILGTVFYRNLTKLSSNTFDKRDSKQDRSNNNGKLAELMCGIVGVVGSQNAKEIILTGLHKLEYRGYDSAGLMLSENSELNIKWFSTTDNDITSILSNLINLVKLGGTVRIPKGTWLCNTSVDFGITNPQKYFNMVGDSGAALKNKSGEDCI